MNQMKGNLEVNSQQIEEFMKYFAYDQVDAKKPNYWQRPVQRHAYLVYEKSDSETRKKLFRAKARRHSTTLQTVSLIAFLLLLPQFIKLLSFCWSFYNLMSFPVYR